MARRYLIPPSAAFQDMMAREAELGVDPRTDPPPPPGPPVKSAPLIRPSFPKPDWRAEEAERARQQAAEQAAELEPEPTPYPAKPARDKKSRAPSKTPNLDAVRAWKEQQ